MERDGIDDVLDELSEYALDSRSFSDETLEAARVALLDTMGCALAGIANPACAKLLGPMIAGTVVPKGSRVPGTRYVLTPLEAAFNFGIALRWLDFNDTWLAAEWGHPSDNLAAILPLADYLSQTYHDSPASQAPTMRDVLDVMIRAYEIQGILALTNSLNRRGLDHVLFVKVASAAACARLFGADKHQMQSAISNAWLDNAPLRTYRHAPNTGSRKSWAAGDASSRGLFFSHLAMKGEMGYPLALRTPKWGVQDVILGGGELTLGRTLQSFVVENILFKVSYPAEFHAQTALEAAIQLHPTVAHRWNEVSRICIKTHESAIRIIDKQGKLHNAADRDHCIQYIVAVGLLKGNLTSLDYEDEAAMDERIDWLRARTHVTENPQYSADYLDLNTRSAASSVTVWFQDGTSSETVSVEYPLGHPNRRSEAMPALKEKFAESASLILGSVRTDELLNTLWVQSDWLDWPVFRFVELFIS